MFQLECGYYLMRPMHLRRSWLFVGAADSQAIQSSYGSDADACIQEFEDFCVPEMRQEARRMMPDVLNDWKARGIVATVRINPLENPDGIKDLDAAMSAGAEAILIPKANTKEQMLMRFFLLANKLWVHWLHLKTWLSRLTHLDERIVRY